MAIDKRAECRVGMARLMESPTAIRGGPTAGPGRMALHVGGEGPPVVLLHGIPGSARVWEATARLLARTHRVAVPDLLGFGASDRPAVFDALWADAQAEALARALDETGIERAAVVGHDFGGPVALALLRAHRARVSHLALCATNAFPDTPVPFPLACVRWRLVGPACARLLFSGPSLRLMLRQGVGAGGPRLDPGRYLGDGRQRRAIRRIFSTALRQLGPRYAPLAEVLPTVDVPTLVVWGDRDPFFDVAQARRTAAAVPGARLVLYRGAGHFLPEERPAELARDVAKLLASRA